LWHKIDVIRCVFVGVYWAHVYRGPCIGIIYTHPSRVGVIHPLFSPTVLKNTWYNYNFASHKWNINNHCQSKLCTNETKYALWVNFVTEETNISGSYKNLLAMAMRTFTRYVLQV